MAATYTIQSIILKRVDHGENNIRVSVLSKYYGRMDLVARGAKKLNSKMAGHLEPITLSSIMVINGKSFDYVGNALGEKYYARIKEDLTKTYYAGRAINIIQQQIKSEATPGVNDYFTLLDNFLSTLDRAEAGQDGIEVSYYLFLFKFMALYGISPSLRSCVACHKNITAGGNHFSYRKGGVLCKKCVQQFQKSNEEMKISDNCIKILRLSLDREFNNSGPLSIDKALKKEIKNIIVSFYRYNLDE